MKNDKLQLSPINEHTIYKCTSCDFTTDNIGELAVRNDKATCPKCNGILNITSNIREIPQHLYWEIKGKPTWKGEPMIDYIVSCQNTNMTKDEIAIGYHTLLNERRAKLSVKYKRTNLLKLIRTYLNEIPEDLLLFDGDAGDINLRKFTSDGILELLSWYNKYKRNN